MDLQHHNNNKVKQCLLTHGGLAGEGVPLGLVTGALVGRGLVVGGTGTEI